MKSGPDTIESSNSVKLLGVFLYSITIIMSLKYYIELILIYTWAPGLCVVCSCVCYLEKVKWCCFRSCHSLSFGAMIEDESR